MQPGHLQLELPGGRQEGGELESGDGRLAPVHVVHQQLQRGGGQVGQDHRRVLRSQSSALLPS